MYVAAFSLWLADTAEIIYLSLLTTVLQPLWGLTNSQAAAIFSSVFAGQVVGTLLAGPLADRFGRRPIFLAMTITCFLFGVLTAAANTYGLLIFFRFMVGVAIGGITVPFDCLAEYLPAAKRGRWLVTLNYSWMLGQLMVILFAFITLGTSGDVSVNDASSNRPWRIFTILAALPGILSCIVTWLYVPESPRWLLSKGRLQEAVKVIRGVAKINKKNVDDLFPLNDGQTMLTEGLENEKGNVRELFKPSWRKVSLSNAIIFFANGFFYFAAMQLSTILSSGGSDEVNSDGTSTYSLNYIPIVVAALFEALGMIYPTVWIDRIGRKMPQLVGYCAAGIAMLLYGLLSSSLGQQAVIMIARMMGTIIFVAMNTQISELLPTGVRGKGHSLFSCCQRMGGFASSYLIYSSLGRQSVGGINAALCFVALGCVYLLPETNKRLFGGVVEHIVAIDGSGPSIVVKDPSSMEEGSMRKDQE